MSKQAKNLVLGFATNLESERLRIFCESLRQVHDVDQCDVVLGTEIDHGRHPDLSDLGVTFVPTLNRYRKNQGLLERTVKQVLIRQAQLTRALVRDPSAVPHLQAYDTLEALLHPHIARWFFYRRVLAHRNDYRAIMICDVKDVFFQAPFFNHTKDERIMFFEEFGVYGQNDFNDRNYIRTYGRKAFSDMIGKTPVCLGAILGGGCAMRDLVNWMVASVFSAPNSGSDQVRGNHLAHGARFRWPVDRVPNAAGAIVHLNCSSLLAGAEGIVQSSDGSLCRRSDGQPVPVVHMYNRVPEVLREVERRFGTSLMEEAAVGFRLTQPNVGEVRETARRAPRDPLRRGA